MWNGVYINIHNTLQVSKMGFQCGKWFLNCDKCSGPFIAEETFSSILAPPANSVMINGGYAESRKRKNGIRSCYCPFSKYFIDWRIKKNTGIMHDSWTFYHYILKSILFVSHSLNVQGKIAISVDIIWVLSI